MKMEKVVFIMKTTMVFYVFDRELSYTNSEIFAFQSC